MKKPSHGHGILQVNSVPLVECPLPIFAKRHEKLDVYPLPIFAKRHEKLDVYVHSQAVVIKVIKIKILISKFLRFYILSAIQILHIIVT